MSPDDTNIKPLSARDAKRLRFLVRTFVLLSIVGALHHAWVAIYKRYNPDLPYVQAQRISNNPLAVTRHVRINGRDLWIAVPYFFAGHIPAVVEQKDVLLVTMFPDFQPLRESEHDLWMEDKLPIIIRWLVQDPSKMISREKELAMLTDFFKATEFKGVQYGLRYYSQSEGVKNDLGELWLEGDERAPHSLIECSKHIRPQDHPQCSEHVWADGFWYKISFDKTLLPNWREIKDKTLALTETFLRNPASQPSHPTANNGD